MLCCFQTAIKKMKKKFYTWEECMQLREIKVTNLHIKMHIAGCGTHQHYSSIVSVQ